MRGLFEELDSILHPRGRKVRPMSQRRRRRLERAAERAERPPTGLVAAFGRRLAQGLGTQLATMLFLAVGVGVGGVAWAALIGSYPIGGDSGLTISGVSGVSKYDGLVKGLAWPDDEDITDVTGAAQVVAYAVAFHADTEVTSSWQARVTPGSPNWQCQYRQLNTSRNSEGEVIEVLDGDWQDCESETIFRLDPLIAGGHLVIRLTTLKASVIGGDNIYRPVLQISDDTGNRWEPVESIG